MLTKKDLYDIEQSNPGVAHLYPEGLFYKAYERSAYLLCHYVHPFKVSCHHIKSVGFPLASIGFPQSSLDKWSSNLFVNRLSDGLIDLSPADGTVWLIDGFDSWKDSCKPQENDVQKISSIEVYGSAYSFTIDICRLCVNLDRTYKYSLGEQVRIKCINLLLKIDSAGKTDDRLSVVKSARCDLDEIQLCLRLLSDLGSIARKRYVTLMEQSDTISRQLFSWERSLASKEPAGAQAQ